MATRVLLVEDNVLARRNIATYLRRQQFEVEEAATGEEAIELITRIDEYDIVVSDLRMPGVATGIDVLACQQQASPRTPTILFTAFGSDEVQREVQQMGVVYMEKPLSMKELTDRIRALLDRPKKRT